MEGPESLNPFRVEEIGGGIVLRTSQNPVRFGDQLASFDGVRTGVDAAPNRRQLIHVQLD